MKSYGSGYQDDADELLKDYKDSKIAEITETPSLWFSKSFLVPVIAKRYIIVIMIFIGFVNMFYLHTNLGMAVVEMTTLKNITHKDGTIELKAEFNWSSKEKGIILSTYSLAGLFSPIGGYIAGRYGGSTVYRIGILVTAAVTFLSPILLYANFYVFVISNVVLGAFETFSYAGVTQLCSRWLLPDELSRCLSFANVGMYVGTFVSFIVAGWMLNNWRWELLFYISGLISFIWFWIWCFLVKNDPADDNRISKTELHYIKEKMNRTYDQERLIYPWKSIFTCTPMWAACFAKFSVACGYIFTSLYLPQYIQDTNNIDIKNIGYISTIPQVCSIVSMPISGYLLDYIRSNGILSQTNSHKLYISIGLFTSSIVYLVIPLWPNLTVNIIAISLFQFFSTFVLIDVLILVLDLAPRYAAFLNSLQSIFYTGAGIVTPAVVGFVVTSHSEYQWNICFIILSSTSFLTALFYLIFGSAELQPWDNYNPI